MIWTSQFPVFFNSVVAILSVLILVSTSGRMAVFLSQSSFKFVHRSVELSNFKISGRPATENLDTFEI